MRYEYITRQVVNFVCKKAKKVGPKFPRELVILSWSTCGRFAKGLWDKVRATLAPNLYFH